MEKWEALRGGYEFDAVVIEDATIRHPQELSVKERLERVIYLAEDRNVIAKFVDGKKSYNNPWRK